MRLCLVREGRFLQNLLKKWPSLYYSLAISKNILSENVYSL